MNKECDVKADIWSAGVTIYKMKTKEELFLKYDEDEIIVLFEDSDKVIQVIEQRLQSFSGQPASSKVTRPSIK